MKMLEWIVFLFFGVMVGFGLTAAVLLVRAFRRESCEILDRIVAERSPSYQFFVGLFNFVVFFLLAAACLNIGPLRLLGLGILFGIGVLMIFGLAARMHTVGSDVLALGRSARPSEVACVLVGGGVLTGVFLVPFLGQLIWLVMLLQCFGTALLWLFSRKPRTEDDPTAPVRPPEGF